MKFQKKAYDDSYFSTPIDKRFFQDVEIKHQKNLIMSYKKSGTLLEIGCGKGELLYAIKDDFSIQGVDVSRYAVTMTNKLFGKKIATCRDVENKPLPGKFDIILAFDVLEHLHDPERMLQEIVNALNKSGVCIITVPNNYSVFGSLHTKYTNFIDTTHISTFKRNVWINHLKSLNVNYEVLNRIWFYFSKSDWTKYIAANVCFVIKK